MISVKIIINFKYSLHQIKFENNISWLNVDIFEHVWIRRRPYNKRKKRKKEKESIARTTVSRDFSAIPSSEERKQENKRNIEARWFLRFLFRHIKRSIDVVWSVSRDRGSDEMKNFLSFFLSFSFPSFLLIFPSLLCSWYGASMEIDLKRKEKEKDRSRYLRRRRRVECRKRIG